MAFYEKNKTRTLYSSLICYTSKFTSKYQRSFLFPSKSYEKRLLRKKQYTLVWTCNFNCFNYYNFKYSSSRSYKREGENVIKMIWQYWRNHILYSWYCSNLKPSIFRYYLDCSASDRKRSAIYNNINEYILFDIFFLVRFLLDIAKTTVRGTSSINTSYCSKNVGRIIRRLKRTRIYRTVRRHFFGLFPGE